MVQTLNLPFSNTEMRVLKRAKEHASAESWAKLFLQLAHDFVAEVEGLNG